MTDTASVLAAEHDGVHWLKLRGDVRLTLGNTIEAYIARMFSTTRFHGVLIDLVEAEGLDSTTLGLLARIAIRCRERTGAYPTVLAPDPGIRRVLQGVGFDRVFDIRDQLPSVAEALEELPVVAASEAATRCTIIEAHRTLMDLDERNRAAFVDLVKMLEES